MDIVGIDIATVGVEDMEAAQRFCADFGFRPAERSSTGATYEMSDRTQVRVRALSDASLPRAESDRSGIRETVWGVRDRETLDRIGAELRATGLPISTPAGVLHSSDDSGLAIAFQVTTRRPYEARPAPQNAHGVPPARGANARFDFELPIELRSLGHVVYFVPNVDAAERFYVERLGFRVTDRFYPPAGERWMRGSFLRAAGSNDHHTLFFIEHAGMPAHLDHIEFHVTDFNEIMLQGQRVSERGLAYGTRPRPPHLRFQLLLVFCQPAGRRHGDSAATWTTPMTAGWRETLNSTGGSRRHGR